MRRTHLFLYLILLTLSSCRLKQESPREPAPPIPETNEEVGKLRLPDRMEVIAFGSCNDQSKEQPMWPYILENKPDLWIWLGDNIYADTENMEAMAEIYRKQKNHPEYLKLKQQCPIIGIWDDHDYGVNDGDRNYPRKKESKELMLDFLGVPPEAPVRFREGAYQSYDLGPPGQQVKVILLDCRYFREELSKDDYSNRRYLPNETGELLGEEQWSWLEKELRESQAQLHIIASGIQVIPEEHPFEKWANFPRARQRLFDLLVKTKPSRPVLLSGDRHLAELSRYELPGLGHPIYEITSSGLTHSYTKADEPNRHRISDLVRFLNFGLLKIEWSAAEPTVTVEVRGLENEVFVSQRLFEY